MPELPEVETIVRGLTPALCGRVITSVDIRNPAPLKQPPQEFAASLVGQTITGVERRAKLAMVRTTGPVLCFHLKMTGRLTNTAPEQKDLKHLHLVFNLSDGTSFYYQDVRKFGYCLALMPDMLHTWPFYATLGPEPLDLAPEAFADMVGHRKARIKSLLLDQKVIAGIGNIYADESLYRARIHPAARACDVSREQLVELHTHMREVLKQAIAENGSSISDYRDAGGNVGAFQNSFNVYGKKGQPCPECGTELTTTVVAGRTSTFCPKCQEKCS